MSGPISTTLEENCGENGREIESHLKILRWSPSLEQLLTERTS